MDKKIERELIADMEHSKGVTVWTFISLIGGIGLLFYYYPKALYALLLLIPFVLAWIGFEVILYQARKNGHTQFRKYKKLNKDEVFITGGIYNKKYWS